MTSKGFQFDIWLLDSKVLHAFLCSCCWGRGEAKDPVDRLFPRGWSSRASLCSFSFSFITGKNKFDTALFALQIPRFGSFIKQNLSICPATNRIRNLRTEIYKKIYTQTVCTQKYWTMSRIFYIFYKQYTLSRNRMYTVRFAIAREISQTDLRSHNP